MEFSINKENLQYELSLVQGIVEKKHAMAILSNIHLTASKDGLQILSTDMEVSLMTSCPIEKMKKPGTLTVSSRKFFEIVKSLPSGAELTCRKLDNDWLEVNAGSSHFEIVGLPADDFPSQPTCDFASGISIPGWIFRSFIPKVVFAITHDEARYSVNGAQFVVDGEFIRLISTDGHRLSLLETALKVDGLEEPLDFLIPRKALVEVRKLIGESEEDEPVLVGREKNHIFFRVGSRTLVARMVEGTFPKYERVMPKENNISVVFNREELFTVIRRVALMSSERSRAVRLQFNADGLLVSSSNPDLGEGRDRLDVAFDQEDEIVIGFNAQYLLDFLSCVEEENIRLDLRDGNTQGLLRPAEDGDYVFRHVIMPMRL